MVSQVARNEMGAFVGRLEAWLEQPKVARLAHMSLICMISERKIMNEHYWKKYSTSHVNQIKSKLFGHPIEWRRFPSEFRPIRIFSLITVIWMIHLMIRFALLKTFELEFNQTRLLDLPLRCYLVGHFVIHESFDQVTALAFSLGYLGWRLTLAMAKPFCNNSLNFMLIGQRDLELIYAKFSTRHGSLVISHAQRSQLTSGELFLLDTMCYTEPSVMGRTIYRLRPNRTRAAYNELRRLVARYFLVGSSLVAIISLVLTCIIAAMVLSSEHYLRIHPNCNPKLERLKTLGTLPMFSFATSWHQLMSFLADALENLLVWTSCGASTMSSTIVAGIQVSDVSAHWRAISLRIQHLKRLMLIDFMQTNRSEPARDRDALRHLAAMDLATRGRRSHMASAWFCHEVNQLNVEIRDFFEQIRAANGSLSVTVDTAMAYCLSLCGIYTYFLQVHSLGRVPVPLVLAFCYLGLCVLFVTVSALRVHRECLQAYTSLCTLAAIDPTKACHHYGAMLEFFAKKRTCFTMLQRPFEATTFLTVVGWAFSCFFIISGFGRYSSGRHG